MLSRRRFVAALAAVPVAKATITSAGAADWPSRSVHILYPYAAGSTGDVTTRLIADQLSKSFGQPFVVENRVGANGIVAAGGVARSPPDGYSLLLATTPQIEISPVMTKVPYDPVRDFVPISAISMNSFALVVNAKLPVKSLAEFIGYARSQSKGFAYAEAGVGSIPHLAMAMLLDRAGISGINVSYNGTQPALTDVVSGHLPATFGLLGDALSQGRNGTVRLLAVSSERRSPLQPELPTIAESGFPDYRAVSWWGLMAPAGTPKAIVDQIALQVGRAVKDQKIVEQMTAFGIEPLGNSPADFAAMISADIDLWKKAVKVTGLEFHQVR